MPSSRSTAARRILVLLSALLLATPAAAGQDSPAKGPGPAVSGALRVTRGLADYQVLQRGPGGSAQARFSGVTSFTGAGTLTATLRPAGQVGEIRSWPDCAEVKGGRFEAKVAGLPKGGPYALRLEVRDPAGRVADHGIVRQILVGDLWILAGQSNMEGCGILKRGAVSPHRLVHAFDMADRWLVAKEPLHWKHESVDVVHSGPPGEKLEKRRKQTRKHRWRGSGLGLPFARRMVDETGVPVGLIPCAHGGTSLDQWSPAGKEKGGGSLYGAMVRRFRAAGGRVRGVLWFQGEADALQEKAAEYAGKFETFVAAVRRDFGQPELPFYYVQLGRYQFLEKEAQWTALREAQRACESSIPPPVGMVAAVDLPLVDAIHLRTSAQEAVGRRLAFLAARDLLGAKDRFLGPRPVAIQSAGGYPKRVTITFGGVNGKLTCGGRVSGFSIRDKDGKDLRIVFDQFLDPGAPNRVVLECQVTWRYAKFPENAFVYYGYGNDPYCNLMDEAGLAAPAFGPLPLPLPKR